MLRYRKNALTGVTRETFVFIWRHKACYAVFLSFAVITYMALAVIYGEGFLPLGDSGSSVFDALWGIISLYATAMATALFAVPLHNFIIKNDESYLPKHPARVFFFACFEFIPSFICVIVIALVYEVHQSDEVYLLGLSYLGAGVVAVVVSVFLATVLPYIAITPVRTLDMPKAIGLSHGHRFTIFAKLFRLTIAIGLLSAGIATLGIFTPFANFSNDTKIDYYLPELTGSIVYSAIALMFITLASLIYRRLSSREAVETLQQFQETVS